MKKTILTALLAFGLGLGLTLIASTPSMAVHKGSGALTCGNCHTMHSSQGGTNSTSMGGASGSFILLRGSVTSRAVIHDFCLECHSQGGSQAGDVMPPLNVRPPKVHLTTAYAGGTPAPFNVVGAGGDFSGECGTGNPPFSTTACITQGNEVAAGGLGQGHSLGRPNTIVPPGNNTTGVAAGAQLGADFTCTSCHDPHGTAVTVAGINFYRNLKGQGYVPSGAANPIDMTTIGNLAASYVGAIGGQGVGANSGANNHTWPVWLNAGSQNSYTASGGTTDNNAAVQVPMSRFCAQCHGAWHEPTSPAGTAGNNAFDANDWVRHPTQRRLKDGNTSSGGGVNIVDFTWYNTNAAPSTRAPNSSTDATKLPAANNSGGTAVYYADNSDDKVFCLSCHFAHAGPYRDALRWDYTSAVSGGSQTGSAIESNVGCQQCHNR